MNKERFNQLVGDYSKLDNQFKDLEILMKEFPYSQPVRMLNIKSSSQISKEKFQERLSLAAFYTTDRNVLRSLIEKGKVPSDTVGKLAKVTPKSKKKIKKKITPASSTASAPQSNQGKAVIDAEKLRNEVLANLELLQKQKHSFLQLDDLDPEERKEATTSKKKEKVAEVVVKTPPAKPKEVVVKSKPAVVKGKPAVIKSTPAVKSRQTNKRDLIDRFIADEPRITPKKPLKENQSDLSMASSELKEDLVSENLALIFARQGKTSKAIDIYKKLIWKFPQKKASFAAQIEVLKKKKK